MWREVPELPRKRRAITGLFDGGVGRGKMLETKMKWRLLRHSYLHQRLNHRQSLFQWKLHREVRQRKALPLLPVPHVQYRAGCDTWQREKFPVRHLVTSHRPLLGFGDTVRIKPH